MIRRCVTIVVLGLIVVTGLVVGDEPPAGSKDSKDESPLRLKRKKREAPQEGDKETRRQGDKEKEPSKDRPEAKKEKEKEEPLVPEDGRPIEDEDEKDVLERIGKNMRAVEEKIANRELGEPTTQQQRDILKDIDSLIRKSEQQSGGGGGGENQPQPQGGQQEKQEGQDQKQGGGQQKQGQQKGGGMQKGGGGGGQQRQMAQGGKRPRRELRSERGGKQRPDRQMAKNGQMPDQPQMKQGMNPGGGGDGPRSDREINTEMVKDHWGHVPESLRAEMNAYSNPQPFLPRYDRLIREYYKTIAEQGRKKGD